MEKTTQKLNPQGSQVETLYSLTKVAKMLGMARATIKRKIDKGLINATKDGLISETSLKNYINGL